MISVYVEKFIAKIGEDANVTCVTLQMTHAIIEIE